MTQVDRFHHHISAGQSRELQQVIDRYVSPMLGDENESLKLDLAGEVPIDPAVREAILKRQYNRMLELGGNSALVVLVRVLVTTAPLIASANPASCDGRSS